MNYDMCPYLFQELCDMLINQFRLLLLNPVICIFYVFHYALILDIFDGRLDGCLVQSRVFTSPDN